MKGRCAPSPAMVTLRFRCFARWCNATAENTSLQAECELLRHQLDEALDLVLFTPDFVLNGVSCCLDQVQSVAEIDGLQASFDEVCNSTVELEKSLCHAMEDQVSAELPSRVVIF